MPPERDHVHLGVALEGTGHHPAAWRAPTARPGRVFDADYWVELVREAERGTLDFVRVDDSFALSPPRAGRLRGRLDAVALLARVAPLTRGIGLVPAATTTHTEPFHISNSLATLDYASGGRAGWWPKVSGTEDDTRLFGRKPLAAPGELLDEKAEFIDVVARLWDSWEDGAVIRDAATGRFVDGDRLHHVDFEGTYFDVRGPSTTPRPPQGRPVVTVTVDGDDALEVAAREADVLYIDVPTPGQARRLRRRAHSLAEAEGRDPRTLRVLADVTVLLRGKAAEAGRARRDLDDLDPEAAPGALQFTGTASGLADLIESWTAAGAVDGFTILPALLPDSLTGFVDAVVPLLRERGLFRDAYTADTLRGHLGLDRPANRYARDGDALSAASGAIAAPAVFPVTAARPVASAIGATVAPSAAAEPRRHIAGSAATAETASTPARIRP